MCVCCVSVCLYVCDTLREKSLGQPILTSIPATSASLKGVVNGCGQFGYNTHTSLAVSTALLGSAVPYELV